MILYRLLLALGILIAAAAGLLLLWTLATEPGNGASVLLSLGMVAWAGGALAGGGALARRGRPWLASLALLALVVPGLLVLGGLAWFMQFGLGGHH
jgi:hypothetical protein